MTTQPLLRRIGLSGLLIAALFSSAGLFAQTNVAINATGVAAHPSAILDVSSTSSGLLVPRMTSAERDAIASPAEGLIIYQTDNGAGFWYYDGGGEPGWKMLSRYLSGRIEMGDAPSTILQGNGYTVTRLATGADELTFNEPFAFPPSVMVTSAQSDGSAPFLDDYCKPEFETCGCHMIMRVRVYGDWIVGNPPVIIDNWDSGCNNEPGMYKYYEAGDAVYPLSGPPDLCLGDPNKYSLNYRANPGTGACSIHQINIWIDWQQDGFFDEMDDWIVNPPNNVDWNMGGNAAAGNLDIPASAFNGDTFMRVVALDGDPDNSCPSAVDGETEEYNIHISCRNEPVYQDVSTYCNIGDVTNNTFRVACRRVGGEPRNVQHYYLQVNENDD